MWVVFAWLASHHPEGVAGHGLVLLVLEHNEQQHGTLLLAMGEERLETDNGEREQGREIINKFTPCCICMPMLYTTTGDHSTQIVNLSLFLCTGYSTYMYLSRLRRWLRGAGQRGCLAGTTKEGLVVLLFSLHTCKSCCSLIQCCAYTKGRRLKVEEKYILERKGWLGVE